MQTDYLDGFQYKYTQPWEDESGSTSVAGMKPRFFPTAEGYYDTLLGLYVYNYNDHLGNVRISYADADHDGNIRGRDERIRECTNGQCIDSFIPGEIVGNNTYYPFGMLFDHNVQVNNSNAYKYKYNGKELQETGWYSFKCRNYMPDVGRFFNVDPLAEKYPTWAPYVFSSNRVVDARELEGLEPHVLFNTRENAAANFGKQYNGKSIKQNQEYISIIYSRKVEGKLYYAYKNPVGGTQAKANVTVDSPKGTSVVAAVHTHSKYLEAFANNEFSKTDINGYECVNFDGFVITPDGSLKYYDVSSNSKKILRTDMPSDPNDPDRKNNIPPNENPSPSSGDYKPDLFPSLQKTSLSDKKQVVLDDGLKSINDKKKEFVEPKIN